MKIYKAIKRTKLSIPSYYNFVKAGFPSPADDYIDTKLDLNELLIQRPNSTFIVSVEGESMIGAGIFPGDKLIIDRSLTPKNGDVILAIVNNDFTIKRFHKSPTFITLIPANPNFQNIIIKEGDEFECWGVVTMVLHKP